MTAVHFFVQIFIPIPEIADTARRVPTQIDGISTNNA